MKKTIFISLLIAALVYINPVAAVLYKGVDAEGNVVYSDTPFHQAEKYTPPPISVVDTLNVKVDKKLAEDKKSAVFKYLNFDIISPVADQTIRNMPDLAVSLRLKPGLNTEENHSIWVLVNGKPVVKNSQSLSANLGRLDRGANNIQAQIRNKEGKVIVRTRAIIVFIHYTSAQ